MRLLFLRSAVLALILLPGLAFAQTPVTSGLWGADGELWNTYSRLPDYSFAGYKFGEKDIPDFEITTNVVTDFGAVGDGMTDDSQAFIDALENTTSGAIFVPEGRYLINQVINLKHSNTVLRGAGPEKTILYFPRSLREIELNGDPVPFAHSPEGSIYYSSKGGLIHLTGESSNAQDLTTVTADAIKGDQWITVAEPENLSVGQTIMLEERDEGTGLLSRHLHGDDTDGGPGSFGDKLVRLITRIDAINGNNVLLERALKADIDADLWQPTIRNFGPSIYNAGVESLAIEFDPDDARDHHEEFGNNAIYVEKAGNCWLRDLHIKNADSSIVLTSNTSLCTIENILLDADRAPNDEGHTGHYGFAVRVLSTDNLFKNFFINTTYIHDTSVANKANGNIFMNGSGVDLNFDHHTGTVYQNLWTNLYAGAGTRLWESSGTGNAPHSAAFNTYWNIGADELLGLPPLKNRYNNDMLWGREHGNFVGIISDVPAFTDVDGFWWEAMNDPKNFILEPSNIYDAQLDRRLPTQGDV